jgi:hypothetical protein
MPQDSLRADVAKTALTSIRAAFHWLFPASDV